MTDKKEPKAFVKVKGRPPTLTQEVIDELCLIIRSGNYIETAAAMTGISKACLYKWFKKAKKKKTGIYRELVDAVKKAMAESEVRDVLVIDKEAHGRNAVYDKNGNKIQDAIVPNWKAAAWKLERKHPERWGRRDTVKWVPGDPENPDDPNTGLSPSGSHDKIMDLIDEYNRKKES